VKDQQPNANPEYDSVKRRVDDKVRDFSLRINLHRNISSQVSKAEGEQGGYRPTRIKQRWHALGQERFTGLLRNHRLETWGNNGETGRLPYHGKAQGFSN
jgi:hypothetical protein